MTADGSDWYYCGSKAVNEAPHNRIGIPSGVFEAEILDREYGNAHWSYQKTTGLLVLSNRPLRQDQYKYQGDRDITGADNGWRATIPKVFFKNYRGAGTPVPEHARVEYDQEYHFVYREGMASDDPKSCYLLTRDQLTRTISEPTEWAGSFDTVPRFIS